MKGVPIKFRGKDMNGQYVYGLLTKKLVRHSGVLSYAIVNGSFKSSETIPVSEDSIAQLVGYDAEGNEVYENDVLQSKLYIEDEGKKSFLMMRVYFNRMVKNFMDGYEEQTLNEPIVFDEAIVKDYGFRQVRKGNGKSGN